MASKIKHDGKARRCMAEWAVPANITSGPFRIDDHVGALMGEGGLCGTWHGNLNDAVQFARRGLEVAILHAQTANEEKLGPIKNRWAEIAERAESASYAMRLLLAALHGEPPDRAEYLIRPLRTGKIFTGPPRERLDAARDGARCMFETARLVAILAKSARTQERNLAARRHRQNEGDPCFRAFSIGLGETWIHLTGLRPSATSDYNQNPFLRFLMSAWHDAGGEVSGGDGDEATAFVRGARAAWGEHTPERVKQIREAGKPPGWV